MATYPPKTKRFISTVLILLMLFSLGREITSASTPVKEDYRAAVDYLQSKTSLQDVIVVSAPFTIYPIEYYYHGTTSIQTMPVWNRYETTGIPAFSEDKLPQDVDQLKQRYRVAWFLFSFDQGYNDKIRTYMDQHYERIDQKSFSENVNLYAYKLRYN